MNIFAIGDLHLSFKDRVVPGLWNKVVEYKPMNIFGDIWDKHYQKLYENWQETVNEEDIVLIPGDISWAQNFEEVKFDLDFINLLPGKKIIIKGNHDYWWDGIGKVRAIIPDKFFAIQNDSINLEGVSIAGTRGWIVPNENQFTEHDEKIYNRELNRLELSLKTTKKSDKLIVMTHYMPTDENHTRNEFIDLMIDFNVDICIYGHLHGAPSHKTRLTGEKWGIKFFLVSSDFINFTPEIILSL